MGTLRNLAANFSFYTGMSASRCNMPSRAWTSLMYHRVLEPELAPYPIEPGMYVTPEIFEMHCEYLASEFTVTSINTVIKAIKNGSPLPKRTLVLTFDDGWYDFYQNAFPILEKYKLPATVFLATGYIESNDLFWSDKLALLLGELNRNPEAISKLDIKDDAKALLYDGGVEALASLCEMAKINPPELRKQFLKQLEDAVGKAPEVTSQFMNWEQIKDLAFKGITFGPHSVTHRMMSECKASEVSDEYSTSLQKLKNMLPEEAIADCFCYPSGDYNQETQKALKDAGCLFAYGTQRAGSLKELPIVLGRIGIHNDITDTLAKLMFRLAYR